MHELSLCGLVAEDAHGHLLQQLAGVTCMQPQHVEEIHLIFKARSPTGLDKVQGTTTGGGSGLQQQQQEFQKLRTMLQSGIFYVQLVGSLIDHSAGKGSQNGNDTAMDDGQSKDRMIEWMLEFKDTPEAAKQPVTTRQVSRTKFEDGDFIGFLDLLGYDYVHRYLVEGERFYTQDTTLFLHRVRKLPKLQTPPTAGKFSDIPPHNEVELLDSSGAYVLQASVDITDGNSQELRDRATRQLNSMKEILKSEVSLAQPDRLSLDTRIPIPLRRI